MIKTNKTVYDAWSNSRIPGNVQTYVAGWEDALDSVIDETESLRTELAEAKDELRRMTEIFRDVEKALDAANQKLKNSIPIPSVEEWPEWAKGVRLVFQDGLGFWDGDRPCGKIRPHGSSWTLRPQPPKPTNEEMVEAWIKKDTSKPGRIRMYENWGKLTRLLIANHGDIEALYQRDVLGEKVE